MRAPFLIFVVIGLIACSGCRPKHLVVQDELASHGSGGPGGLSTVRMKLLAAIAARNYEQARHLLELAADLTDEERARFEQMISAAERKLIPFLEDKLSHIFRAAEGHFERDTAEARELIQTTATEDYFAGISKLGNRVYQRVLDTGIQIWVWVRNDTIREAGRNEIPLSIDELLK